MGTNADSSFVGSIPALYERLLVPLIFAAPAADTAAVIAGLAPGEVLETAAGTGVLTRALVDSGSGSITATDLNSPMLDAAAQLCPSPRVRWRVADAMELPFEDGSFDLVVCQFGVMFLPDKVRGFAEARRVLRDGGTFLFTAWNRIEASPAWCVVSDALAAAAPDDPPQFLRRTPYSYFGEDVIRADLRAAGFTDVVVEVRGASSTSTASRAATAICQATPLRTELAAHPVLTIDRATEIAHAALRAEYGHADFSAPISWLRVVAPR